ncbi:UNVERIFIED_CONTAM: eEF1A lysine and N-terminal methyltransferase [Sesamum radiatum]|uniref:EEF1A lysine and N-terminal methyltransferase n=1 Tax=Sesamum radiatum TaxID=300843 RepID=A0AAW2SJY6_SESRA
MGKKDRQPQKSTEGNNRGGGKKQEELLKTLGDFTSKENWDQFFTIRGSADSFEWYAEWPQLQNLLTRILLSQLSGPEGSIGEPSPAVEAAEVSILVPGCGNSRLSEHLYDAGFKNITNVDFSKVVISDMLRKNFGNESFNAIVDKGGLDALMEPQLGPRLGNLYLSEVKRLLKLGGKYICLTLAESHVLDLLFPKFRLGWKMSLYAIAQEPSSRNSKLRTFMVVAEKDINTVVSEISLHMDECSVEAHDNQVCELYEALEREKKVRSEYLSGSDILYSLEDLNLGAKGNLKELEPGRRAKLILGEPGVSHFIYNGILLDAQQDSGPFSYHFGVFLVPKNISDPRNFDGFLVPCWGVEDGSLSLSKAIGPGNCDNGVQIPFMAASDGIKHRQIVHQVTSALTGPIVVDDVIYEKIDNDLNHRFSSKDLIFRRLVFQRTESLVQSEALLLTEGSDGTSSEAEKKKLQEAPKSRKKGRQGKNDSLTIGSHASSGEVKADHNYLASSYHNGIISGLLLISLHLKGSTSAGGMVKTVVIGLGAGLLPMFMKKCLPSLEIEVVELDPVVRDVARDYFGFREDERLKVHVTDGIEFVREKADSGAEGNGSCRIDTLIVDVDSSDSSSGLTCPAADFVDESFLLTVKSSLSEQGLFIINLVSRSSAAKVAVYSRLKKVRELK